MSAFATVEELQAFWKTLTTDEQSRATTLLEYSSNSLRMIGRNNQINIDTEKCIKCLNCVKVCPFGAIEEEEK